MKGSEQVAPPLRGWSGRLCPEPGWASASPASMQAWPWRCSQPELPWWPRDAPSHLEDRGICRGGAWCSSRWSCAAYSHRTRPGWGCCCIAVAFDNLVMLQPQQLANTGPCIHGTPRRRAGLSNVSFSLHHHPAIRHARGHGHQDAVAWGGWRRACCSQGWRWGGGKGGGKGKVTGKKTERKVGWAGKGEKGKHGRQSKPKGWDAQVESQ